MFSSLRSLGLAAALVVAGGTAAAGEVEWHSDALSSALGAARGEDKLVLVYCWMGGSPYCADFWQDTMTKEPAQEALGRFVCYSADNNTPQGAKIIQELSARTLPSVYFLRSDGQPEDVIAGYAELGSFLHELDRIGKGEKTLSALKKTAKATEAGTEEGMEARYALAVKFDDLGLAEQHEKLWQELRAADPDGETLVGSRLVLEELVHAIAVEGGGDAKMPHWDLGPLYVRAKKVSHPVARFELWQKIGNLEAGREDVKKACKAFSAAWDDCPEEMQAEWAHGVASYVVKVGETCSSKERKFGLKMAAASVDLMEQQVATAEPCETQECTEACDGERRYYLASRMATLARALDLCGKDEEALEVLTAAKEMAPDCEACEKAEKAITRT